MSTWTDDFERGDGGLGNNWTAYAGSAAIASGRVNAGTGAYYYNPTVNASGRQEAIATTQVATNDDLYTSVAIKVDSSNFDCYHAYGAGQLSAPTWYIVKRGGTGAGNLRTVQGSAVSTGQHTIRFLYDSGILTLWVDGALIATTADSQHGDHTGAGFICNSANDALDALTILGDETVTLSVSPSPIGNFGQTVPVTFTGVSTSWTAGTPGTPTFTVDHGSLSDQEVTSATSATATYTPGTFLGIATFADPSTGATAQVTVTSDPSIAPPPSGPGGLSQAALDWLNAQAEHGGLVLADNDETEGEIQGILIKNAVGEILLGKRTSVGTSPYPDYVGPVLADIFARLWAGEEWQEASFAGPGTNAVKSDLLTLLSRWDTGNPPTQYSIAEVLDLLGGTPLANHQDILTAISGIVVDNTEVLDAIEAAQGDPLATIKAVLDSIFVLGGSEANYTLATVKTWVEAGRGTNLPTIRDVLNKLGTSGNTIEARIDALSDLIVTETTIQGMLDILLTAVTGGAGITIATATDDIIDAVSGIDVSGAKPQNLWPGAGNAEIGEPIALSDGLVVTGPLNGLLFTITGTPSGAGKYVFGDVDSWQHTGGVIFCTDNGYYERAESFGLETQIVVPRTMEQAASAVVRLNSGWSGTVRAWTRTV